MKVSLSLACEPEGRPRRVRDLAAELGVATTYMAKVIQGLVRAGLVRGIRGPGGGVHLARPASQIRQWDVLEAMQSTERLEACVLSWGPCKEDELCPLHEDWTPVREHLLSVLRTASLLELARRARPSGGQDGGAQGRRFGETV